MTSLVATIFFVENQSDVLILTRSIWNTTLKMLPKILHASELASNHWRDTNFIMQSNLKHTNL